MTEREKIEFIEAVLREVGTSGTPYRVAQLLGVSPSSIQRWCDVEAAPRSKQREALDLLYRIAKETRHGNAQAKFLFDKLLTMGSTGLLSLGLAGVVGLLGLRWLTGGIDDDGR